MSSGFFFSLLFTVFGLFAARQSPTQSDAEIQRSLEAQYKKLAEAHERRDLKAIVALKAADFHAIFPDGRVGDAKQMAEYSKQFLEMNKPPYNISVEIASLAVSENKVVAVAEVQQRASRMRELAGKLRKVDTSVKQRETWVKTPGGWKLKCADSVRDQMRFVDGKRVDPTKPYDPDAPPFDPDGERRKNPPPAQSGVPAGVAPIG